jgi:hypothetical protein
VRSTLMRPWHCSPLSGSGGGGGKGTRLTAWLARKGTTCTGYQPTRLAEEAKRAVRGSPLQHIQCGQATQEATGPQKITASRNR